MSFFSELSSVEGKIKYQQYKIKLIAEEFGVLVPYAAKVEFFNTITEAKPTTKQEVINILSTFNGKME